jgi:ribosomal 30S subunit maturation factor RimM
MVATASLQPFAEVVNLFGNNGTIVIKFRPHALTIFKETEPVFALMDGLPVPFFIATCQIRGNDRAHILFDAIYREAQTHELVGKTLYQKSSGRKDEKKGLLQWEDPILFVGFNVSDKQLGLLGQVDAFMDWDMNPCVNVRRINNTETFLVPFHPEFITNIDVKTKHISLSLPEGFGNCFNL